MRLVAKEAEKPARRISRPLNVLVPLIKTELEAAEQKGMEHYRRAGEMLLEARELLSAGSSWASWLAQNFLLSKTTARRYMRYAERMADGGKPVATLSEVTERTPREHHQTRWYDPIRTIMSAPINKDFLASERKSRDDEITLHRDLALELIDIGYKALATRLHPDKGGSRDAMRRLNRVREELKHVAETRRFE